MTRGHPVARFSALGLAEVELLWQSYFVSRDEGIRNKLLVHYLPLSRGIARHLWARLPAVADMEDLAQAAALGMRDAIAGFDPARGIKFEHYCGRRVRGAALDFLRRLDWAPRMLRSRLHRLRDMETQLEMETGQCPSDEHLSEALRMPLAELQSMRGAHAARRRLPLAAHGDADGGGASGGVDLDLLPDRNPVDPVHEAQRNDLREFLTKGLGRTERLVIMLHYYDAMSFREIGQTLDLCESRISQIHNSVLKRLRERSARIG